MPVPGHGLFMFRANDDPRTQGSVHFMKMNTPDAPDRFGELRGTGQIDPIAGTVFPNLSFNMMPGIPNLRMWMPKAHTTWRCGRGGSSTRACRTR